MYDYQPNVTLPSKTLPGVTFTVRKMSEATRDEFRLLQSEPNSRLAELTDELEAVQKVDESPERRKKVLELTTQMEGIVAKELDPGWLKWGLVSVDGITISGQPVTAANVRTGPLELYWEVMAGIKSLAGMSEIEIKNYVSLSISGAQADTATNDITALSASAQDTTAPETVPSTSQTA